MLTPTEENQRGVDYADAADQTVMSGGCCSMLCIGTTGLVLELL
eukprot:COSAG02_NODE_47944_length_337_cov_1.084034_1_plen_43_part_01